VEIIKNSSTFLEYNFWSTDLYWDHISFWVSSF